MRMLFAKLALLLALALILTACMTTGGSATKAALCDQFQPVRWSGSDTAETVAQIKAHNAVGMNVCGWKP